MISKNSLFYSLGLGLICVVNDSLGAFRLPEPPDGPIIIIRRSPDLIFSDLEVIAHPTYDIAYRYTIQNIGNGTANLNGASRLLTDNVSIQAFVSEDTVYGNSGDLPAGGAVLSGTLAPGASLTFTFGATVNFDPAVHRYLVLKVDASNGLTELNENNNTRATMIYRCYRDLPNPVLRLKGTEESEVDGHHFVRYNLEISNWADYPDALFDPAPDLPACGANTSSARAWVDIYDANGDRLYGFCSLGEASHLQSLWFAIPDGGAVPMFVYVEITDRRCGQVYRSQPVLTARLRIAQVVEPERRIRLAITSSDSPVFIEASVDLVHWERIDSPPPTEGGVIELVEPAAENAPMRFYRAVALEQHN